MDGSTVAAALIYGVLGLVPLLYNYKAARRMRRLADAPRGESRVYVVLGPRQVDLDELESLLGTDNLVGVVRRLDEVDQASA